MTTTVQMTPQNFSIPAGYDDEIAFDVNPVVTPTLEGCSIWWRAYNQQFGIPNFGFQSLGSPLADPVIAKASPQDIIVVSDDPPSFVVRLYTADTIDLLRNYYHEITIINAVQEVIGVSWGLMTVLETQNR